MKKVIIALLLSIVNCQLSIGQIGTWRNYLAYYDVQQIQAAGDELFVLASNGLYQYNKKDQSITTYDKVKGLSDTHISHIRWCQQAKRLIATYSNTNIDLIDIKGNITNISDIYTKVITGDKTINNVYIYNQYAYLACGFGIVKVNVKDANISESYMLGFPVTAITISDNTIYAQTSQGILEGSLNSNLIDKANWQQANSAPSFVEDTSDYDDNIDLVKTLKPGGPKYNYFGFLKFTNDKLYSCGGGYSASAELEREGTIQLFENNNWTIYEDSLNKKTGRSYIDVLCLDIDPNDNNHVMVGARSGLYEFNNGKFVECYNQDNSILMSATSGNSRNYVLIEGLSYDSKGNLWMLNSQSLNTSIVEYNTVDKTWESHHSQQLMTSGRSLGAMTSVTFDKDGNFWFINDHWIIPSLYRFNTTSNTLINTIISFVNQDGTKVDGHPQCLVFDKNDNLWVGTNIGPLLLEKSNMTKGSDVVMTQVKVPRNDGTNYADYLLSGQNTSCIAIDGGNRKWIGTKGNGVFVISSNNLEQVYHFQSNNSNLLSDNIESIAINNKTGEVFIGTDKGLCSYMSDASQPNEEMTSDNVYAYPNPVTPEYSGLITITGLSYDADIKILSANGKLIIQGRSNGGIFTWNGCDDKGNKVTSGIYMVATAKSNGEKGTVCKIAIIR